LGQRAVIYKRGILHGVRALTDLDVGIDEIAASVLTADLVLAVSVVLSAGSRRTLLYCKFRRGHFAKKIATELGYGCGGF